MINVDFRRYFITATLMLLSVDNWESSNLASAAAFATRTTTVSTSRKIRAPFIKCHSAICDLRTHYCDDVISSCSSCSDDCHPGRIKGDPDAEEVCNNICAWYYVFKEYSVSTKPPRSQDTATIVINTDSAPSGKEMHVLNILSVALVLSESIIIFLLVTIFCLCKRLLVRNLVKNANAHLDQNDHCRTQDNVDSLGLMTSPFNKQDDVKELRETSIKTANVENQTSIRSSDGRPNDPDHGDGRSCIDRRTNGRNSPVPDQSGSLYPLLSGTSNSTQRQNV